jgi:hypothetical protein
MDPSSYTAFDATQLWRVRPDAPEYVATAAKEAAFWATPHPCSLEALEDRHEPRIAGEDAARGHDPGLAPRRQCVEIGVDNGMLDLGKRRARSFLGPRLRP